MKKFFLYLCMAVILTACGSRVDSQKNNLVISDPAKNLEATAGNEFKIVLDSNPGTGYHWELDEELDGTIVQFVSNEYVADEPAMPGSGGRDVWIFKAVKPGEVHITLSYYPPSNDAVGPQQKVTFTVTVK
ncbi:MAG: protease inhibitor I42 family protein [Chloroflexi bacterium]|nr:protease inhibitor I42 family protein [Chloroflexota bacterium]